MRYESSVLGTRFVRALSAPPSASGQFHSRRAFVRRLSLLGFAVLVVVSVGLTTGVTLARSEAETQYTMKQTYSAALRYVRVELGFEVVERDPEAAYLLFKYQEPGVSKRIVDAAIELVETKDGVRVIVRIPAMPAFHERLLRDGLLKKLASDYGAPPPKAKPTPPKKAPPANTKSEPGAARDDTPEWARPN